MKPYKRVAKALGHEVLKRRNHPTANGHVINLIRRHDIDLVLDVGANRGQFGAMLRDEGYRGEIHSFEPVSSTFAELESVCAGDRFWTAHHLALGEVAGEATINITGASDLSSILKPNAFGQDEFAQMEVARTETVPVNTVADFLAHHIADYVGRRIFLKMDTQGYDLQVFAGAREVLARIVCVLSELSLIPIYSGMPNYLTALGEFEAAGFVITGLYPISRRPDFSVIEMDCMLLNKLFAEA